MTACQEVAVLRNIGFKNINQGSNEDQILSDASVNDGVI